MWPESALLLSVARKGGWGAESYFMLEQIDLRPGGTVGASSQAVDEGWRCSIVLP